LYAGEQFDSDLGFYYNRARYLNVETGRFISQDSYEGRKYQSKSLHKYTYAENDGINMTDPTGMYSISQLAITAGIISVISTIALGSFTALTTLNNIEANGGFSNFDGFYGSFRVNNGRLGGTVGAGLDLYYSRKQKKLYYSLASEYGLNPASLTPDVKAKYDSESLGLVWGVGDDVQSLAGAGVSASFPLRALPLLRSWFTKSVFSEMANFATYLTVAGNRAGFSSGSITFGVSTSGPAILQFGFRSTSLSALNTYNDEFRPINELPPIADTFGDLFSRLDSIGNNPEALAQAFVGFGLQH
jgi:RHS repeat-associated protein